MFSSRFRMDVSLVSWTSLWGACIYFGLVSVELISVRRELIAKGQTGGLVIFDDRPNYWDAWGAPSSTFDLEHWLISFVDVEIHHLETAHPLEFSDISVVASGPLRASIKSTIKYGKSTITTTVGSSQSNIRPFY